MTGELVDWLRRTEAVEVRTFANEYGVWVTNGKHGDDWEGAIVARCFTPEDADLIAFALRVVQKPPRYAGTLDTAYLMQGDRHVDDVDLPDAP